MHRTPTELDRKIFSLFEAAYRKVTGDAAATVHPDGISILTEVPAETMRKPVNAQPSSLVFEFDFQHHAQPPELEKQIIHEAFSHVPLIASGFGGLKQQLPLTEKITRLTSQFPAGTDSAQALTVGEVNALTHWASVKNDSSGWGDKGGANIRTNTRQPLTIEYNFIENVAIAAKTSLEARQQAIREKIIETATPFLTPEQQHELAQLRIDVNERKSTNVWSQAIVNIGLPDAQATQKLPNGMAPLKASAALNTLMEKYEKEGDTISIGEKLVRNATLYAGENWQAGFSALAGPSDMREYMEMRMGKLQNEPLKAALQDLLSDPVFLTAKEREAKNLHPGADFKLEFPTADHPTRYRLTLTLPEKITAKDVYESILATPVPESAATLVAPSDVTTPAPVSPIAKIAAKQPVASAVKRAAANVNLSGLGHIA